MDARSAPGIPLPGSPPPRRYLEEVLARPVRLGAAAAATAAGVAFLLTAQAPGRALPEGHLAAARAPGPSTTPTGPEALFQQAAGTCPGLDWRLLAGIYAVETSSGGDNRPSSAGALGPMQFLPATWAAYAADGNGDGRADVLSLPDAARGAARLLCADGAARPSGAPAALYAYNHSWDYVDRVEAAERSMAGAGPAHIGIKPG